jgi:hypothetical protein
MENYAFISFAVAALGGLYMAVKVFKGVVAPWSISFIHAGFGAAGLILLIWAYASGSSSVAIPLAILMIAALGGFFLASFHLRGMLPPKVIVIIHALVAVIGVGLLVVSLI